MVASAVSRRCWRVRIVEVKEVAMRLIGLILIVWTFSSLIFCILRAALGSRSVKRDRIYYLPLEKRSDKRHNVLARKGQRL